MNVYLSDGFILKKNAFHITYILDIFTKPTPLCSPTTSPVIEPCSTTLASLLAELAYLTMLFIPQVTHTARSACHLRNKWHKLTLGKEFDGRADGENNGICCVEISKTFATHDSIFLIEPFDKV